MKDYAITPEKIYEATNKGLEIYTKYLSLPNGVETGKVKFKYRDTENTPSSILYLKENVYLLCDFGGNYYNPVTFVSNYFGLNYGDAIKMIADDFGLSKTTTFYKAEKTFKPTKLEDGHFKVVVKPFANLKTIGANVPLIENELNGYNFYEVDYYEKVVVDKETKETKLLTIKATDNYPIFCYSDNLEVWAKLYEPKAIKNEKGFSSKHSYLGTKPNEYVHGLQRLINNVDIDYIDELRASIKKETNKEILALYKADLQTALLSEVYICSGGSDGLNVASLGKNAVWLNSEAEIIPFEVYKTLRNICKGVYLIPDIDKSGKDFGKKVALKYWDLKTIWLESTQMTANGKDFRDWLDYYKNLDFPQLYNRFNDLKNSALQCKFYDSIIGRNGLPSHKINLSNLHYFLTVNNFYTYVQDRKTIEVTSEEETVFVQILKNNVVSITSHSKIRSFCENYLKEKGKGLDVINMVKASPYFGKEKLEGLDRIKLNFNNKVAESQTFFFENTVVNVSEKDINFKYENKTINAFEKSIINKNVIKEDIFFELYKDENGNNRAKINYDNCDFLNFLIQGSRVFWKKELESPFLKTEQKNHKEKYFKKNKFTLNGKTLAESEHIIQEQHFLNKCYSLGYILHQYKRSDYTKMLYIMDDAVKDSDDDANGRTGKSLFAKAVSYVYKNMFPIDGKDKNITKNAHIFHGLDENNQYIIVNDADKYLDFKFFYTKVTDGIGVNPKKTKPYFLDYSVSPKLIWTTNYGKPNLTGSDLGRLLFVSFSDYYHEKTDLYLERRSPATDFGYMMFEQWDNKQWNLFYNFMLQCCQFYLQNQQNEISAPMDNITINNLNAGLGDTFIDWANNYFTEDLLDVKIFKEDVYDNYKKVASKNAKAITTFKKSLKDFCVVKNKENKENGLPIWVLNPIELANKQGRFIENNCIKPDGTKTSKEFIFIQTKAIVDLSGLTDGVDF